MNFVKLPDFAYSKADIESFSACVGWINAIPKGDKTSPKGVELYNLWRNKGIDIAVILAEYRTYVVLGEEIAAPFSAITKILPSAQSNFIDDASKIAIPLKCQTVDIKVVPSLLTTLITKAEGVAIPVAPNDTQLQTVCKIIASVGRVSNKQYIKAYVTTPKPETIIEVEISSVTQTFEDIFINCHGVVSQMISLDSRLQVTSLSGTNFADILYQHISKSSYKIAIICRIMECLPKGDRDTKKAGWLGMLKNLTNVKLSEDTTGSVDMFFPKSFIAPPVTIYRIDKTGMTWKHVMETTRSVRTEKDSGMSNMTNDYFFGAYVSRSLIRIGSVTKDLLRLPEGAHIVTDYDMSFVCNLAIASVHQKKNFIIHVVTQTTGLKIPNRNVRIVNMDPLPEKGKKYVYLKKHHDFVKMPVHIESGPAGMSRMNRWTKEASTMSHRIIEAVDRWRTAHAYASFLAYVDGSYALNQKDWIPATQVHTGHVMICSTKFPDGMTMETPVRGEARSNAETHSMSTYMSNMCRLYYPLYGIRYFEFAQAVPIWDLSPCLYGAAIHDADVYMTSEVVAAAAAFSVRDLATCEGDYNYVSGKPPDIVKEKPVSAPDLVETTVPFVGDDTIYG